MTSKIKWLAILVAGISLLHSCRPSHGETGVRSSSATWSMAAENPIPGIDVAAVEAVTIHLDSPDGLKVVFWSAGSSGSSMRSSSGPQSAVCEGSFAHPGGRIPILCETKDGRDAAVVIDSQKFQTDQGTLFLIARRDSKVDVLQLDVDVMSLPTSIEKLRSYARSNDRIIKFFSGELKASDSKDAK
ncbi:hypothetical protein KOR42_49540 [Thalassoglobus neptunius]|uniref:Uncharacterized protein n=1 Tax=Thalassoglobus neptunius TaxID=1938619 RepID=A0A5C5VRH5_9PLAN|nr:hypothetical protein [Thalassoglobus neptunius]TWT40172.1 hypothetical protein KOR42_49540 [Thalassoglobus neptunius]